MRKDRKSQLGCQGGTRRRRSCRAGFSVRIRNHGQRPRRACPWHRDCPGFWTPSPSGPRHRTATAVSRVRIPPGSFLDLRGVGGVAYRAGFGSRYGLRPSGVRIPHSPIFLRSRRRFRRVNLKMWGQGGRMSSVLATWSAPPCPPSLLVSGTDRRADSMLLSRGRGYRLSQLWRVTHGIEGPKGYQASAQEAREARRTSQSIPPLVRGRGARSGAGEAKEEGQEEKEVGGRLLPRHSTCHPAGLQNISFRL